MEYSSIGEKLLTIVVKPLPDTGSPFHGFTDLAFAPNWHLFITDGYGNARILVHSERSEIARVGREGTGPGEFHLPHAIQIGPDGIIYVADRENGRIEKFDPEGKFLAAIDHLGRCYALVLRGGVLWASMSPMNLNPAAPGWLLELDLRAGRFWGMWLYPMSMGDICLT